VNNTPSEGPIVDLTPDEVKPVAEPRAPETIPAAEEPASVPGASTAPAAAPPAPAVPPAVPVPSGGGVRVTFLGNTYDLAAYGALISGIIVLASCLTCNTIYYCLPLAPIILGLIGVVSANQAVDARRTRIWSWIGIAAGGFFLLVVLAGIILYVAFIVLMIYLGKVD
jgi:hypothetical protein